MIDTSDALLYNEDIAPIEPDNRTWGFWPLFGAWASIAAPSSMLVGSVGISFGFNWWQVLLIALVGDILTLIPLIVQAHGAVIYGLAEPQLDRTRFGIWGTFIPSFCRFFIGLGFWGVQTFLVTEALVAMVLLSGGNAPEMSTLGTPAKLVAAHPALFWSAFTIATVLQFLILIRAKPALGSPSLRLISKYMPVVSLATLTFVFGYFVYGNLSYVQAAFNAPAMPLTAAAIPVLLVYLSSNVHATQVISWPDIMRFAKSYKVMLLSQIGLPIVYTITTIYGALMTAIVQAKVGQATYDPILLVAGHIQPSGLAVVILLLFALMLMNTNIFSNAVPPIYDLNNAFPKYLTWTRGAVIVTVLSIAVGAWSLYAEGARQYFNTWLQLVASLLGPFTGIIMADYVFVRKFSISLPDVFSRVGQYTFYKGFNVQSLVATAIAFVVLLLGRYDVPGFVLMSKFGWLTGLVVAMIAYLILVAVFPLSPVKEEEH